MPFARVAPVLACAALISVRVATLPASPAAPAPPALYEGARLIAGNGSAPVENGAMLVRDGRIAAVGARGSIAVPPGSARVDLTGKTILPAFINVHVHIGYEGFASWGAANHTPENILNHLERQAFYGVGATMTAGSNPTDASRQFQADQRAGRFPPASQFLFMPGMAPPHGGPDHILLKATSVLNAVSEVTTGREARDAVRRFAGLKLGHLKIWVDDRRGTYPKMPPAVYTAIIGEAHAHGIRVHAHAITLADQKAVIRAGADVLVHTNGTERVDSELLALIGEKKPYWISLIGLGDRSEACNGDTFVDQSYPAATLEAIRAESCGARPPAAAARDETLRYNVRAMVDAGARLVLGTDAGIFPRHAFGWSEHHEMARWVELGLAPQEAIVAATSRPAELLGLSDLGTLAPGKRAHFVVLDANPLDGIRHARRIADVYLDGARLDRTGLLEKWGKARSFR
jgi:imidazolonepropionase-like amidohydrolase